MRCFLISLRNNDRKWTIPQNDLHTFTDLDSFILITASHSSLMGIHDGYFSFNMNVRSMLFP